MKRKLLIIAMAFFLPVISYLNQVVEARTIHFEHHGFDDPGAPSGTFGLHVISGFIETTNDTGDVYYTAPIVGLDGPGITEFVSNFEVNWTGNTQIPAFTFGLDALKELSWAEGASMFGNLIVQEISQTTNIEYVEHIYGGTTATSRIVDFNGAYNPGDPSYPYSIPVSVSAERARVILPPGNVSTNPVLPTVITNSPNTSNPVFTFTNPQSQLWYDPPSVWGFQYDLIGGALFTEVEVPDSSFGFDTVDVLDDLGSV
jgi:hypothetical protein